LFLFTELLFGVVVYVLSSLSDTVFSFFIDQNVFLIYTSIFLGLSIIFSIIFFAQLDKSIRLNYLDIKKVLGKDINDIFSLGKIGLIYYSDDYEIMFTSEMFKERGIEILGQKLLDWCPNLKPFFDEFEPINVLEKVVINNIDYKVHNLEQNRILVFIDDEELSELNKLREKEQIVWFYINIDNLDEIKTSPLIKEEEANELENDLRRMISDYTKRFNLSTFRIRDDQYIGACTFPEFTKIRADNFSLVYQIRNNSVQKNGLYLTISLGFGVGTSILKDSIEGAREALNLAYQRGGDQVAIKTYSQGIEIIGGTTSNSKTHSSSKLKAFGMNFFEKIRSPKYENIFIMGHIVSDMDAIGASLGVYAICKKNGLNALIVYEDKDPRTRAEDRTATAVALNFKAARKSFFILPSEALSLTNSKTLLILVDFSNMSQALNKAIIEKTTDIIVIDHHRKQADAIDNTTLDYVDTNASSTSEIVSDLIRQNANSVGREFDSTIATFLLSGILLDTKYFRSKETTTNTFEIAAFLKERGGDNSKADDFLKDDYNEYVAKSRLTNNVEVISGGIYITFEENEIVTRTLLSRFVNDLICLKDVVAAFAIGKINGNKVAISARTNENIEDAINVGLIMEKFSQEEKVKINLGSGGGRFADAGGTVENLSIEEVVSLIKKLLANFLADARKKE
jgi:c-di-AMP phosphodiesterase-like protein